MRKIILTSYLFLAALAAVAAGRKADPVGRLAVSECGRFLQYADGRPFFWLGDTGWLLPERLDRDEAAYYLGRLADAGYNVVQVQVINAIPAFNAYGQMSMPRGFNFEGIDRPGVYSYKNMRIRIDFFPRPAAFNPVFDGTVLYFAADSLRMPLTCRGWKPADRFRPFGMQRGSKKLSDLFTDLKMDRVQKLAQPVIVDASGQIVCLPGLRIDDRFKIKAPTTVVGGASILSR